MAKHHFDTEIAEIVGPAAAVIAENLRHWGEHKWANQRDVASGLPWVYNSVSAWGVLFPYLSASQIRTAVKKLEAAGLIKTREPEGSGRDRTKWYAFVAGPWLHDHLAAQGFESVEEYISSYPAESICQKSQMHLSKIASAFAENRKCYNRDTNNNPDNNQRAQARARGGAPARALGIQTPTERLGESAVEAVQAIRSACVSPADQGETYKLEHCLVGVDGRNLIIDAPSLLDRFNERLRAPLERAGYALALKGGA